MFAFFRKHFLLTLFFGFLGIYLFLGDGQQLLIDTIATGGTLILVFTALLYGTKKRTMPPILLGSWIAYLCYLGIRTWSSFDIGYSLYTMMRVADMFLIFFILYTYSTEEDRHVFPKYVLGFVLFAFVSSFIYTFVPTLRDTLPNTNLLVPTYGHNHVVDLLMFGIPIAFWAVMTKKSFWYTLFLILFLIGVLFSLARAAMLLVIILMISMTIIGTKYFRSLKKRFILFLGVCIVFLGVIVVMPPAWYSGYLHPRVIPKIQKSPIGSDGRFEYFRQAIMSIREQPIVGSGPGTFILQSRRYQSIPDAYSRYAHNIFLEEWATTGIIGLVLLVFLIGVCGFFISQYMRKNNQDRYSIFMLSASALVTLSYACMDFTMNFFVVSALWWAMIAILLSYGGKKMLSEVTLPKVFWGILGVVIFWYMLLFLTVSGFRRIPYIYVLSEGVAKDMVQKNDQNISDSLIFYSAMVHRDNAYIQCPIFLHAPDDESDYISQAYTACIRAVPYDRYTVLHQVLEKKDVVKNKNLYGQRIVSLLLEDISDAKFSEIALSYEDKVSLLSLLQRYDPFLAYPFMTSKEKAYIQYIFAQLFIATFDFHQAYGAIQEAQRLDPDSVLYHQCVTVLRDFFAHDTESSRLLVAQFDPSSDMPLYTAVVMSEMAYRMSLELIKDHNEKEALIYAQKALRAYPWKEEYYVLVASLFSRLENQSAAKNILEACINRFSVHTVCTQALSAFP